MHPCSNQRQAQALRAIIGQHDEYAVITAQESVVRVFKAKSQSVPAMSRDEFEQSKKDCLELAETMIPGLDRTALGKQADQHAPRSKGR